MTIENEEWRRIEMAPRYEVSNIGRVRNRETGLIMKPKVDRYGYPVICLINGRRKRIYPTIHRLVALAFKFKSNHKRDKLQVNHIDGNKLNNNVDNLEWVSASKNIRHSYSSDLNLNHNWVYLKDLKTKNLPKRFVSIKALSKYLKISMNVLIPLIKFSASNPILGKYTIWLDKENEFEDKANVINFGRNVYIYDHVMKVIWLFKSRNSAAYYTGLRRLSKAIHGDYYRDLGYIILFRKEEVKVYDFPSIKEIQDNRYRYVNLPYAPYDCKYKLFDYFTQEEYIFDKLADIVTFIRVKLHQDVSDGSISSSLTKSRIYLKNGLVRGFGIQFETDKFRWYPYTEEILICSRNNRYIQKVYRVRINDNEQTIIGLENLAIFLKLNIDFKYLSKLTTYQIEKLSGVPNIKITRLNKPIQI